MKYEDPKHVKYTLPQEIEIAQGYKNYTDLVATV